MIYNCRQCSDVLMPKLNPVTALSCKNCGGLNVMNNLSGQSLPAPFRPLETMSPFGLGTEIGFEMSEYQLTGRLFLLCDEGYRNLWSLYSAKGDYKMLLEYFGNYFFLTDWRKAPDTYLDNLAVNATRKYDELELRIMSVDVIRETAIEGEVQFGWPNAVKGAQVIEAGDHVGNAGCILGSRKSGGWYAEGKMCGYDDFTAKETRWEGVW